MFNSFSDFFSWMMAPLEIHFNSFRNIQSPRIKRVFLLGNLCSSWFNNWRDSCGGLAVIHAHQLRCPYQKEIKRHTQSTNSLKRSFNSTAKFPLANRINDWIGHRTTVVYTTRGLRNFGWKFYHKVITKNEIGPLRKKTDHKTLLLWCRHRQLPSDLWFFLPRFVGAGLDHC